MEQISSDATEKCQSQRQRSYSELFTLWCYKQNLLVLTFEYQFYMNQCVAVFHRTVKVITA